MWILPHFFPCYTYTDVKDTSVVISLLLSKKDWKSRALKVCYLKKMYRLELLSRISGFYGGESEDGSFPWLWRLLKPPKRRQICIRLRGGISQLLFDININGRETMIVFYISVYVCVILLDILKYYIFARVHWITIKLWRNWICACWFRLITIVWLPMPTNVKIIQSHNLNLFGCKMWSFV